MTIITWPGKNVTNSLKASKINVASPPLSPPPPSLRKKDTGHSQHLRISILEGKTRSTINRRNSRNQSCTDKLIEFSTLWTQYIHYFLSIFAFDYSPKVSLTGE